MRQNNLSPNNGFVTTFQQMHLPMMKDGKPNHRIISQRQTSQGHYSYSKLGTKNMMNQEQLMDLEVKIN